MLWSSCLLECHGGSPSGAEICALCLPLQKKNETCFVDENQLIFLGSFPTWSKDRDFVNLEISRFTGNYELLSPR